MINKLQFDSQPSMNVIADEMTHPASTESRGQHQRPTKGYWVLPQTQSQAGPVSFHPGTIPIYVVDPDTFALLLAGCQIVSTKSV